MSKKRKIGFYPGEATRFYLEHGSNKPQFQTEIDQGSTFDPDKPLSAGRMLNRAMERYTLMIASEVPLLEEDVWLALLNALISHTDMSASDLLFMPSAVADDRDLDSHHPIVSVIQSLSFAQRAAVAEVIERLWCKQNIPLEDAIADVTGVPPWLQHAGDPEPHEQWEVVEEESDDLVYRLRHKHYEGLFGTVTVRRVGEQRFFDAKVEGELSPTHYAHPAAIIANAGGPWNIQEELIRAVGTYRES